jgi:hypothetical protein
MFDNFTNIPAQFIQFDNPIYVISSKQSFGLPSINIPSSSIRPSPITTKQTIGQITINAIAIVRPSAINTAQRLGPITIYSNGIIIPNAVFSSA